MWSNQENRVRKQVKNPCEVRKIKASQNLHKIISTHLLTWLIIGVILQLEQKRGHKGIGNKFRTGVHKIHFNIVERKKLPIC